MFGTAGSRIQFGLILCFDIGLTWLFGCGIGACCNCPLDFGSNKCDFCDLNKCTLFERGLGDCDLGEHDLDLGDCNLDLGERDLDLDNELGTPCLVINPSICDITTLIVTTTQLCF